MARRYGRRRYRRYGRYKRKLPLWLRMSLAESQRDKMAKWPGAKGTQASLDFFGVNAAQAYANRDSNDPTLKNQWQNRVDLNYWGAGDYKDTLRSIGKWGSRAIGAIAGAGTGFASGGLEGLARGAKSGFGQGADFSRWMGWGDYSTNQIMGGDGGNQTNVSVNMSDYSGDVFLQHTEFVTNVYAATGATGSSPFEIRSYPINPGLPSVFPFCSQIAQNFELYDFSGLIFQYKPLSGENANSTTQSLGKLILATQYDPEAAPFINAVQMENYQYANSSKPSCGILHGVETANRQSAVEMHYIRTGKTTRDKIFTDYGTFYIATEGVPGPVNTSIQIGEIYVTYYVKLSRANLYGSLLGRNLQFAQFKGKAVNPTWNTATSTDSSANTLDIQLSESGGTMTVTFPESIQLGYYSIEYAFFEDVATMQTGWTISNLQNCALVQIYTTDVAPSTDFFAPTDAAGSTNTTHLYKFAIEVQAPGNLLASFDVDAFLAGPVDGNWQVTVTQINVDMVGALP